MPFKSEKQRRYLHAKHPKIAKRWEAEYGAKPKKKKKSGKKTATKVATAVGTTITTATRTAANVTPV